MAEKKKKETKKESKKKTTSKKDSKTKNSKIKLTYRPLGFNAKIISFPLYKKDENGVNKPLIEGIDMYLKVSQGEVIEVTKKQFEKLQAEGCVETDEEYEKRKAFIKGMKDQYPKTYSDLEVAEARGDLISAHESQRVIYNDKLIRVD